MSKKINLNVKARSKRPGVTQLTDNSYEVRVSAPPVDGKANQAVIKTLAAYFSVPKSSVEIIRGHTSPNKTVTIAS